MANGIAFLAGLIDLPNLSFKTGISVRTLNNYKTGITVPRGKRLTALKSVYSNIQSNRLMMTGVPKGEAFRMSVKSRSTVNRTITKFNKLVKTITGQVNRGRVKAGKSLVDESVIRFNMSHSKKKIPGLEDSPEGRRR